MKTIRRNLDEIGGTELTEIEKSFFRGGDVVPECPVKCQLWESFTGNIGDPDCCPYNDWLFCQNEIENYYSHQGWFAFCWETGQGAQ
jgi:hypothetical protein